jgi:hypothetical protein
MNKPLLKLRSSNSNKINYDNVLLKLRSSNSNKINNDNVLLKLQNVVENNDHLKLNL